MGSFYKRKYQLDVCELWKDAESWHQIPLWTTIKLKSMVQELEFNLCKKFNKFHKPKSKRWKKRFKKLLPINPMFISTDNLFMITPNNFLFKKELWSSSTQILKVLKESQQPSEQKSFQLLITLNDLKKFLEHVNPLNKFWLDKIKLSSSQDASEMRHAPLS